MINFVRNFLCIIIYYVLYNNENYVIYYYLLKIIQKFWLVKSGGWNRHIRSVVAQIWSYDIIIEYWKLIYDIVT